MTEALWWDFNIEIFLNANSLRYFNGKQLYSQISLLPWAAVCDELRRRLAGRSRQAAGDCNYAGVVSPCNRSWSRTAGVWYPTAYHISKDIFLGHTQIGVEFFWHIERGGKGMCVLWMQSSVSPASPKRIYDPLDRVLLRSQRAPCLPFWVKSCGNFSVIQYASQCLNLNVVSSWRMCNLWA